MEYIYAALLLHKAGKEITENAVSAVLSAAGIDVNDARIKALVAALDGVDIEEAISKAAFAAPAAATTASAAPAASAAPSEPAASADEDEEAAEEDGMAGLGALFG